MGRWAEQVEKLERRQEKLFTIIRMMEMALETDDPLSGNQLLLDSMPSIMGKDLLEEYRDYKLPEFDMIKAIYEAAQRKV